MSVCRVPQRRSYDEPSSSIWKYDMVLGFAEECGWVSLIAGGLLAAKGPFSCERLKLPPLGCNHRGYPD